MSNKFNVLLIDDELDFLFSLSRLLSRRGIGVKTANGGQEGLDILEHSEFDCIILDLCMPTMDGLDTLKRMRQRDQFTPVILLTGKGDMASVLSALNVGEVTYLSKPCLIEDLITAIENASERKSLIISRIES